MSAIFTAQQLGVSFRRHDAHQARELFDVVEEIYRKSYVEAIASGNQFNSVDAFMRRFQSYSSRAGLDLVVAYHNDDPIGQTWGWPLGKENRWWDGIKSKPDPHFTDEDGRRTFALSEIMVAREWAGKGIAHALHDLLLSERHEQRATLLVRPENPARRAYERWGWISVTQLQPKWKDAPVFDVMVKELSTCR
jgi:ribosomal protein S18 acetylase RimI-like enzyme